MIERRSFTDALGLEESVVEACGATSGVPHEKQALLVSALAALGGWISAILFVAAFGSVLALAGQIAVPGVGFVLFGFYLRNSVPGILGQQMGAALVLAGIPTIAFGFENISGWAWLNFGLATLVALITLFKERGGYLLALLVAYSLVALWATFGGEAVEVAQAEAMFGEMMEQQAFSLWPAGHLLVCLGMAAATLFRPWAGFSLQPVGSAALLVALLAGGYGEFGNIFFGNSQFFSATWLIHGGVEYLALVALLIWARVGLASRLLWGLLVAGLFFCFALPGAGGVAFLMMVAAYVLGWRSLGIAGFIGAVWAVSRFYYALDFTLLVKSGIMVLVGLALLVLNRWLHGTKDMERADA
ncbi:MAG: DUF4401 domain-containing protein [Alphaproteobacteria bacterium]|nr:DUF4401 domain-containing protein [Alphaproteobacteria bacterium]